MPIEEFCAPIRRALSSLEPRVRVIAEPGRYIAAPAAVAVSSVMGRALRDGRWWYYLDDGLYGSYSGQMYDHATYPVEALVPAGPDLPLGAGRADLRQHRRDQRALGVCRSSRSAISSSGASMGAYTWASRLGIQFLSARHGAGARSRPALARRGRPVRRITTWSRRRVLKAGALVAGASAVAVWAPRARAGTQEPASGEAPRIAQFAHAGVDRPRVLSRRRLHPERARSRSSIAARLSQRRAASDRPAAARLPVRRRARAWASTRYSA